ncbi:coil containing protein [Vibrio phage 1.031.O._10N.261.46.F8]|nr:coil containing protein [Vibrio phage 1.031.O._10N.261.46.F8]
MMSSIARMNRGAGNGGEAYRNSPVWDNLGVTSTKDVEVEQVEVRNIEKVMFDMDGVWVNWQVRALELWTAETGCPMTIVELNRHAPFHDWVEEYHKRADVFSTLPSMPDVMELVQLVQDLESAGIEVGFLTGCGATSSSELARMHADKCYWLTKYLPDNERQVITVMKSEEKYQYAKPGVVLVDDFDNNCKQWLDSGGRAVLHKNAAQTRVELKQLIHKL